jgi:hypothetical protein
VHRFQTYQLQPGHRPLLRPQAPRGASAADVAAAAARERVHVSVPDISKSMHRGRFFIV